MPSTANHYSSDKTMRCIKLQKTSAPTCLKDVPNLKPMSAQVAFEKFAKETETTSAKQQLCNFTSVDDLTSLRSNIGDRVATLGSDGMVYCDQDNGMFCTVLAAYHNHWWQQQRLVALRD